MRGSCLWICFTYAEVSLLSRFCRWFRSNDQRAARINRKWAARSRFTAKVNSCALSCASIVASISIFCLFFHWFSPPQTSSSFNSVNLGGKWNCWKTKSKQNQRRKPDKLATRKDLSTPENKTDYEGIQTLVKKSLNYNNFFFYALLFATCPNISYFVLKS